MVYNNCLKPITLQFDGNTGEVITSVPCGKCALCASKKRFSLSFILNKELENHKSAVFLTLTYDNDNEQEPSVKEMQKFIKRLRKNSKKKIRYYICSEHGEKTQRPHYHAIIYGLSKDDKDAMYKSWKKGFIHIGNVNKKSINYITKYCLKSLTENNFYLNDYSLRSKHPPLGYNYLTNEIINSHRQTNAVYFYSNSGKPALTQYFKKKIFPDGIPKIEIKSTYKQLNVDKILFQYKYNQKL